MGGFPRRSSRAVRPQVVLYHAPGCHLCERAREAIALVAQEREFEFLEVDITGDADLEARYRELLPVVEIDGSRAFVFEVAREEFRDRVALSAGRARGRTKWSFRRRL